MKQKSSNYFSESIDGVIVFRDDIDVLILTLKNKSFDIEITDSKCKYDDIDELITLKGNTPNEILFEAKNAISIESVVVSIKKNTVRIQTSGSDQIYSFGFELKAFFQSKIPWYFKFFNPVYFWILIILTWITSNIVQVPNSKTVTYPSLVWFEIFLFIIWFVAFLNRNFSSSLNLVRKHQYGFWKRNSDKILLAVLSALIGSVLTVFVEWLAKNI